MVNVLLIDSLTVLQNGGARPISTFHMRRKGGSEMDLRGDQGHRQQVNGRAEPSTLTSYPGPGWEQKKDFTKQTPTGIQNLRERGLRGQGLCQGFRKGVRALRVPTVSSTRKINQALQDGLQQLPRATGYTQIWPVLSQRAPLEMPLSLPRPQPDTGKRKGNHQLQKSASSLILPTTSQI